MMSPLSWKTRRRNLFRKICRPTDIRIFFRHNENAVMMTSFSYEQAAPYIPFSANGVILLNERAVSKHIRNEIAIVNGAKSNGRYNFIWTFIGYEVRNDKILQPTGIWNEIRKSCFVHTYAPK